MNITELDESQGLTVEMLHFWLLSYGWRLAACEQGCGKELVSPSNRRCNVLRSLEDFPWSWALIETRMTAQALLREINPRMRKGMPSKAAREAHGFKGGMWVGSRGEAGSGGTLVFVSFDDSSSGLPLTVWDFSEFDTWEVGQSEIDDEWLFWPADESGNKIRWYTDAEGNML